MDSLITAAARALAAGDPLGALNRVALREDAAALALRGIAMAQLGDLERARLLFRRAARGFGAREAVAKARCVVAEAEIALVSRNLQWPVRALETARATLETHGDVLNAGHARLVAARRHLLVGRLDQAEKAISGLHLSGLPPALRAAGELVAADLAIRTLRIARARAALVRATEAADRAGIAGLTAEVEAVARVLDAPAARILRRGGEEIAGLAAVEALVASGTLVVDAFRSAVRLPGRQVSLATRPVLFALVRALAEASPGDVARDVLVARAFGGREADESHRARLRVEIGRLRAELRGLAEVTATGRGFALSPLDAMDVAILAPLAEHRHSDVLALLADGEAWSSSGLATVLDVSGRTMQRALEQLLSEGRVQPLGQGRSRRWVTPPLAGFPPTLLLPIHLPDG